MEIDSQQGRKKIPIKEGLFCGSLSNLDGFKLAGSVCRDCGEVSFGKRPICPNCGNNQTREIALSRSGKLWTYTVIRHRPPGDFKGPQDFVPFVIGLVELPEGLRVLSPIECEVSKLKIDMKLQLEIYNFFENEAGKEVLAFRFRVL